MSYKFTEKPKDDLLGKLLTEAEDNFATQSEVSLKAIKTTKYQTSAPVLKELKDGDERAYDDGSNMYLYRRIGARLFKIQMTEI